MLVEAVSEPCSRLENWLDVLAFVIIIMTVSAVRNMQKRKAFKRAQRDGQAGGYCFVATE